MSSASLIHPRVGAEQLCHPRRHPVVPVVVSRRMGHAAAVILQIITCPDCGVGFVEWQSIATERATEQASLPRQMSFNHRPHLPREIEIAPPQEVPKECVDVDSIHVVMRVRHVAVCVQRRFVTSEVDGRIRYWRPALNGASVLLRCPVGKVAARDRASQARRPRMDHATRAASSATRLRHA